jgi:transketolase
MRETLVRMLVEEARRDERICLLTGDHGYAIFDDFRTACPGQFLNCGIAEQNMVGMASGMAKAGMRPIVYGLSSFVPMRVLEQIKLDICYEKRGVVFLGDGAGFVYAQLGVSHQCCEDVAVLRSLEPLRIYSPCDRHEMEACVGLALAGSGPAYLRIGKSDAGVIHQGRLQLESGKLLSIKHGSGTIAWLTTGAMVGRTRAAAVVSGSSIWSVPCLKPIDEQAVGRICSTHEIVVTTEEHSVHGGLGSIVSEIAAEVGGARVCRIGVIDPFLERCGSYEYLLDQHGLTTEEMISRVTAFVGGIRPQTLPFARAA